jgi:hypothetical protein
MHACKHMYCVHSPRVASAEKVSECIGKSDLGSCVCQSNNHFSESIDCDVTVESNQLKATWAMGNRGERGYMVKILLQSFLCNTKCSFLIWPLFHRAPFSPKLNLINHMVQLKITWKAILSNFRSFELLPSLVIRQQFFFHFDNYCKSGLVHLKTW